MLNRHQQAILDSDPNTNKAVTARAGTGKTTLSIELAKQLKDVLFVSFSSAAKEAIKAKDPDSNVRTTHSLGLEAAKQLIRIEDINPKRDYNLFYKIIGEDNFLALNPKVNVCLSKHFQSEVMMCLSLIHSKLSYNFTDLLSAYYLSNIRGLVPYNIFSHIVTELFKRGCQEADKGIFSFNDMLSYAYRKGNVITRKYQYVILDEAQDTSRAGFMLCKASCSGYMTIVGDDRQTVYQFAGAENNTLVILASSLNAVNFSMPLSYRCPENIRSEVLDIVPDFLSYNGLKSGTTANASLEQFNRLVDKESTFVLGRVNQDLLPIALHCMKHDIPFTFHRPKLKESLISFVDSIKGEFTLFMHRLELKLYDSSPKICDLASFIYKLVISTNCTNIDSVYFEINKLFSIQNSGVRLATVHSVKGDEAKTIILLNPYKLDGNNFADENLRYVAKTRSQSNLYYLNV